MTASPAQLSMVVLLSVLALNYVVVRTDFARARPAVFWGVVGGDVALAVGVLLFGVPGYEHSGIVRLLIGLVMGMHVAQNFQARARWNAEDREQRLEAELAERRRYEAIENPPGPPSE